MNLFSLTEPFPALTSRRVRWRICYVVSLFVTLFLLVFQPFRLQTVEEHKLFIIAAFGSVTFTCMVLMFVLAPALLPRVFREDDWVVWKSVLHVMIVLVFITTGNFLLSAWLGYYPPTIDTFLHFTGITLAVGFFPVTAFFFLTNYFMMRKYLGQAQKLSRQVQLHQQTENQELTLPDFPLAAAKPTLVALYDEEGRMVLQIRVQDLLCLVAADNYTEVHYLLNGELKKDLIRNSLKNMEQQLRHSPQFYRCHRSYIINLDCITDVIGNAQGYKLKLPVMSGLVPVSRSRSAEFGELLNRLPAPKMAPLAPKS